MKKTIFRIASILCSIFIVVVLCGIIGLVTKPNKTQAASEYNLVIKKTETVSVYVTGENAKHISSTLVEDTYLVEEGTQVTLYAVNEMKIFESWSVSGIDDPITTNPCEIVVGAEEVTVEINRRDPVGTDRGKYMYNKFVITEAEDLLAIQNIIKHGPTVKSTDTTIISYYDKFFMTYPGYDELETDSQKAQFITTKNFHSTIQYGYYFVEGNIALMTPEFIGIGTPQYPFRGVFDGNNDGRKSKIISTITTTEQKGNTYYGLFGILDAQAVIRNLQINTSIGIASGLYDSDDKAYIGGVAGYINNALLYNLDISSTMSTDVHSTHVHVGGIAGHFRGGLSELNKITYKADGRSWGLNVSKNNEKHIYAGYIAGVAKVEKVTNPENANLPAITNTYKPKIYFKNLTLDLSGSSINVSSESGGAAIGNLLGYIYVDDDVEISDITIYNEYNSTIQCTINSGEACVGGLIGFVEANNTYKIGNKEYYYNLEIGRIKFESVNSKHSMISQTLDSGSTASVFCGGLFGYILSNLTNGKGNVYANDDFKTGYYTEIINEKEVLIKNYIFNGDISIKTVQNGIGNVDGTTGKAISGGIVGKGLFDINGSDSANPSKILLSDGGRFEVTAIQSATSSTTSLTTRGDIEHCIASMVYGIVSKESYTGYKFNYVNVYANNAYVTATREVGSRGMGDISVAGYNGYINGSNVDNINLFVNSSKFDLQSLSYEIKNGSADYSNNAYCGGIFSHVVNTNTVQNLKLAGFNEADMTQIGTTLKIGSIQNTQAGGEDTRGENYVGGIIGHCQRLINLKNCYYIGSETEEDEIIMQGHQNPDTSFCGGILGLCWEDAVEANISFDNLEVINATIKGYGTVVSAKQPDMYVAGVIGASFRRGCSGTTTMNNLRAFNTQVYAIGNEKIEVYAAGICGAVTWSATQNFSNCYVYDCYIDASANAVSSTSGGGKDKAFTAGICSHKNTTNSTFSNCVVIETTLNSYSKYNEASVSGLACRFNSGTTYCKNNYLNETLIRNGQSGWTNIMIYGGYDTNGSSNNYYTNNMSGDENPTDGLLMTIELDDYLVGKNPSGFNLVDKNYTGEKFYPIIHGGMYFQVNNCGTDDPVTIQTKNNPQGNVSDLVDLWINAKDGGSANSPLSYETLDDARRDGWFLLETIVLYTGKQNGEMEYIDSVDTTYIAEDGNRYKYDSEVDGDRFLHHEDYEDYKIQSGFKETPYEDLVNKTQNKFNIFNEYDIKLYDVMPYMEIEFTIPNLSLYHIQLLNSSGESPTISQLKMYGTFELVNDEGATPGTINYKLIYYPNENPETLMPFTFYVTFSIGSGTSYEKNAFRFVVTPNVKNLVDVELADYTPALNERIEGTGTSDKPYIFRESQTIKFIPVFLKSNDFTGKLNNDDTNVQYVDYSLNDNIGTMKSSGELLVDGTILFDGLTSDTFSVDISVKDGKATGETITVYFEIARDSYSTTFSMKGTDIEGSTYASSATDYYFDIIKYSNYGGVPSTFTIKIGSTTYDLVGNAEHRSKFTFADGSPIVFSHSSPIYNIRIPKELINGKIEIDVQLSIIYEVKLVINNSSFNPQYNGAKEKIFYVSAGQTLYEYFFEGTKTQIVNGEKISTELEDVKIWIDTAGVYGYTFNGFYLVDDASSLNSYGKRFEDICTDELYNMQISTNVTFYGSWSFLVELLEAPGTTIKSSFPDAFMKSYKTDLVNNVIMIPINNNRGYVFTIEKDPSFYGEASVKAYSVTEQNGENSIEEITIEKYHDNMYLYFIAPEKIKGYLVIQTSATNSEIIVGENTSKVSEEIIPADGIYTFKYAVNHTNINGEKSYIYNYLTTNNTLKKDFVIEFYKEQYNPLMKYARFTSSDGLFSIDVRNGELGHTYNGHIATYYLEFRDTNEFKTTIVSNEITEGIKNVELLFDYGSVDDAMVEGMKVFANTELAQDGWVEIDGAKGAKYSYDTITYSFDTAKNYKYFYITNETGSTKHVHKFSVVDSTDREMLIDLDKPLDANDTDKKLDRTFTFNDGLELSPRNLKIGTIIKAYYYKYIDGVMVESIISSYEVELEDISKISLSDFTLLDGTTKAFNNNQLFSEFLGTAEGVISEVYYFSITPTNGTDFDEVDETNYVIHSGYVDSSGEFIVGDKTSNVDIDNIPLEEDFGQLMLKETSLQERVYTVTHSRDTYLTYNANNGNPYYSFCDIDDYSVYNFEVEGVPNPESISGYIPLVNQIGYNTIVTSENLKFYLGEIKLKLFSPVSGIINIYGSVDGVKWSNPMSIEVEALVEKEYILDVSLYDFIKFKIDSEIGEEVELRSLTINDKVTMVDFEMDFTKNPQHTIEDGVLKYEVKKDIVGDSRHDGKKFVLALQLYQVVDGKNVILSSIPGDIYLKVGEDMILPNNSGATGLNVMYFNLSSKITDTLDKYDFTIENLPTGYKVALQLLEVSNVQKPAMGEVRCQIIDGVHTPFKKGDYSDHDH